MEKSSVFKDSIKYGIILGMISIIISVLVYIFDLVTISIWSGALVGLLNIVIYFIVMLILLKNYRDKVLHGFMNYGKGILFATITAVYASLIIAVYTFLFNEVIDTDYQKNIMEKITEMTVDNLYQAGLPDDQIEKIIDDMQSREIPSSAKSALLSIPGNIILVLIVSLIAAAFAKKKKDPYLAAMEEVELNETDHSNS
jgi:hypothetical protein